MHFFVLLLYIFSISVYQMLLLGLIVTSMDINVTVRSVLIMLLLKFLYLVCNSFSTVIKGTADQHVPAN